MQPSELGKQYDKIAQWWHEQHLQSSYGIAQVERAIRFAKPGGQALDAGCGAGGRLIRVMHNKGYRVTGIDASAEMVKLAKRNHPEHQFFHKDICEWATREKFDFIVAWDSLFHIPFAQQKRVLRKLSSLLASDGVLIYTFGNAHGEHTDQWHGETFYYSSIGINENMRVLMENGLSLVHLELDQFPEQKHVYTIAIKR